MEKRIGRKKAQKAQRKTSDSRLRSMRRFAAIFLSLPAARRVIHLTVADTTERDVDHATLRFSDPPHESGASHFSRADCEPLRV